MSLVALGSAKGAPGVTTVATALAAVWPELAVLADCDPAGGDLALRLRAADGGWLARDRGIVGLAATARVRSHEQGQASRDVAHQIQYAVGGLPVLVGLDGPAQARALDGLWPSIADTLATRVELELGDGTSVGVDVIADCGRLTPGAPSEHVLARADAVVIVTGAGLEGAAHVRHALEHVRTCVRAGHDGQGVWVAVVGSVDTARRDVADMNAALESALTVSPSNGAERVPVRSIAWDPRAAAALSGAPSKGLDRSALVASTRRLASDVHTQLASASGPTRHGGGTLPDEDRTIAPVPAEMLRTAGEPRPDARGADPGLAPDGAGSAADLGVG